jgi:branched-subunit amino acid ABC-type transport system permease component
VFQMFDFAWGQFALVGGIAACVFVSGAKSKGIRFGVKTWFEIAQACAIAVLLFALLSEGRGCAHTPTSRYGHETLCIGDARC